MTDGSKSNLELSSITKVSKHIPSDFSISTRSSFRNIVNKHDVNRGKDCMTNLQNAMKIIKFKKKKMKLLTKEQQESY